jgi:hypothetical protein
MRSRFEADVAFLIDNLGYAWKYEPQSYLLEDGTHYWPDFYIPDLNLYIECRGYESAKGENQINGFAKMINNGEIGSDLIKRPQIPDGCEFAYSDIYNDYLDYLVIGPNNVSFNECTARFGIGRSSDSALCECKQCGRWFFVGVDGSYQCRYCGKWDGNQHINDMRWLEFKDGALCIGYRYSTIKEFVNELTLVQAK